MKKELIRKSIIASIPLLMFLVIFVISLYLNSSWKNEGIRWFLKMEILQSIPLVIISTFIFISIIFYFLFKYQKDEYHNKSIFWKIPLIGSIIGFIFSLSFLLYIIMSCSTEGCLGIILFVNYIPIIVLIAALIAFIFSFNSWYKTNLYFVAYGIGFISLLILSLLIFVKDFVSSLSSTIFFTIGYLFLLLSLLFPTIGAIILKKVGVNFSDRKHLFIIIAISLVIITSIVSLLLYINYNYGRPPLESVDEACYYLSKNKPVDCPYQSHSCGYSHPAPELQSDSKGSFWDVHFQCLTNRGGRIDPRYQIKVYKDNGEVEIKQF